MVDEDEDLAAAIALSQRAGPPAAEGDDPELAAALALSATNNGLRNPPPAQSGAQEALAPTLTLNPNPHPHPNPNQMRRRRWLQP